jgi:CheY-like chemotaxis protein
LILLDLLMPVMDGFEFLQAFRQDPDWREVPVIVLTAKDLTQEDRHALDGLVQRIVSKGMCGLDDLLGEVEWLLRNPGSRR